MVPIFLAWSHHPILFFYSHIFIYLYIYIFIYSIFTRIERSSPSPILRRPGDEFYLYPFLTHLLPRDSARSSLCVFTVCCQKSSETFLLPDKQHLLSLEKRHVLACQWKATLLGTPHFVPPFGGALTLGENLLLADSTYPKILTQNTDLQNVFENSVFPGAEMIGFVRRLSVTHWVHCAGYSWRVLADHLHPNIFCLYSQIHYLLVRCMIIR